MKLPPFLLNERKALTIAIGLGLAFRFVLLLAYLGGHNWKGETWEYEDIVNNLMAGKGYTYSYHGAVYRSLAVPLFPVLCYLLRVIGGPQLWFFYAFHLLTAAVIIGLTYFITRRALGPETAAVAAVLIA